MRKGFVLSLIGMALLFALAMALSGCIENPSNPPDAFANVVFTPFVSGCAETGEGPLARDDPRKMEPTITVDGNSIIYDRKISHQCCRTAEITHGFEPITPCPEGASCAQDFPDIIIYENWSGEGCRCMCNSELGARVDNIREGFYFVKVFEKGVNTYGSPMQEEMLFQQIIEVPGKSGTILISVNGTSFAKGEEINFSIANNSSQSVFLPGCNALSVEKFSAGNWSNVNELMVQCIWEGIAYEIKAGEAMERKINSIETNVLNSGTYRLSVIASIGCTPSEPLSQANCSSELTAKSAEFSITEPANTTTIYYRGKQCELWPWSILCEQGCQLPDEIELISDYYKDNYGIEILGVSVDTYAACEACFTCPSSEEFAAVIYENDKQQMLSLGWKEQPSSE